MKDEEINDEEYKAAVEAFFRVYKRARERYNLRMASHFSLFDDDWIEVKRWHGDKPVETLFKVKEEGSIQCYERATVEMQHWLDKKRMEEQKNG